MAEIKMNDVKIEPNSNKYRKEEEERKKLKPVISKDKLVSRKKSLLGEFISSFASERLMDVSDYIIKDVIIPGAQNLLIDSLSMMFFHEPMSRDRYRERDYYRTDYTARYRSRNRDDYYESRRNSERDRYSRRRNEDEINWRDIILRKRLDAEDILNRIYDRIRDTGNISIAEVYDLFDAPSNYTDNNYGWEDERDIRIKRVSSGFLLDFREPVYLRN